MRTYSPIILGLLLMLSACAGQKEAPDEVSLSSPDGTLELLVQLDDQGQARYQVLREGTSVLESSALGMTFDEARFDQGLTLEAVSETTRVEDEYSMLHGKQKSIRYEANERRLHLVNDDGEAMDILFRVSDDGVAFRYHFPGDSEQPLKVADEATSFNFDEDARAWLQQMQVVKTGFEGTNPAYEEHYEMDIPVGTESPSEAGWVFPALFQTGETWVLLSEVGLQANFHGARLRPESPQGEYRIGFPMEGETTTGGKLLAENPRPFSTPWRSITLGSLNTVVNSTMGTDLAEPAIEMDTDFIEPGVASWSWGLLKDESITYDIQKEFIDYAADMNWDYALVDVNWDETIGYDRMQELVDYGKKKGVGLFLWYNSSGDWNTTDYTPKSRLITREQRREEFARLQEMGVRGVKIDFFPGDGQSSYAYYHDILQDAADFELMVNHHGSTLPRGIHRTYPHMMTMESVHGMEMVTFGQNSADLQASHAAMLPFARNVFDPMDFTPTVFDTLMNPEVERTTTNGFQLALPVVFISGIEHIVETPKGMTTVPDYVKTFLGDMPVAWDESRLVVGEPGKLAVFARRHGDRWYVAGINGESKPRQVELDLSFIDQPGTLITDGDEPKSFERSQVQADSDVALTLKPAGGFVMVFE